MTLAELRQSLNNYEQSWSLSKLFLGDHVDAITIRNHLNTFNCEPDTHTLTPVEVFNLLKIIPKNSQLKLIKTIKDKLNSNYLFDLFDVLVGAGVVTVHNFPAIYNTSNDTRAFLHNLFCGEPSERIPPSEELYILVFSLTYRANSYCKAAARFLHFLNKKNQITDTTLHILRHKTSDIDCIHQILVELDSSGCLNYTNIVDLKSVNSLYTLLKLLQLLRRANIRLNDKLLNLIHINKNIPSIVEIATVIIDSKECPLDLEVVIFLLSKDYPFFFDRPHTLKLLNENALLDKKAFNYICSTDDVYFFGEILKILAAKLLLKDNEVLVSNLIYKNINSNRFYKAISYLSKLDFFNQDIINDCLRLMLANPEDSSRIDVFNLLEELDTVNFAISKIHLNKLFSLSDNNIYRLYQAVIYLIKYKLLDQNAFETALARITLKLPSNAESSSTKDSRKDTKLARSRIILSDNIQFFKEHNIFKGYDHGGYGKVKKAYKTSDSDKPIYGIKKLKAKKLNDSKAIARREVKYNRLLGRQAYYYSRKGLTNIVADWQIGYELNMYTPDELKAVPIENRLKCLASGLRDLNTLHANYRIHNDIKCNNFILDLKTLSMKLIDFGGTHKRGSSKFFAWTAEFQDPNRPGDNFSKDLYAMGLVTMFLFPELYTVRLETHKTSISVKKTLHLSVAEQAVINLINSMMHNNHFTRCTSEDALNYCDQLISNFNQLDAASLEIICKSTINRTNTTVEDILRMKLST